MMNTEAKQILDLVEAAFTEMKPSDHQKSDVAIGRHKQHWELTEEIHKRLKELGENGFYSRLA